MDKRKLTKKEIQNIVSRIQYTGGVVKDVCNNITEHVQEKCRQALENVLIVPEKIPELCDKIVREYNSTLVSPGTSVGVITAQSIGEKNTQSTLNSVIGETEILIHRQDTAEIVYIGKWIDSLISNNQHKLIHYVENRTVYLQLDEQIFIPSTDGHGFVSWYRIEAVTKHLPVGKLVRITTRLGRTVTATRQKSFLVWNGSSFSPKNGDSLVVGDIVPTTARLEMPIPVPYLDLESLFPRKEYLHTSKLFAQNRMSTSWLKDIVSMYRRARYKPNCVYPKHGKIVSHVPLHIPLTVDFGFLIGVYLSRGWTSETFVNISTDNDLVSCKIKTWCDLYDIPVSQDHDVRIYSSILARLLRCICGNTRKRVPETMFRAPRECITGLLDGYFCGNGVLMSSITSISESQILLTGIQWLLTYFGIVGKMSEFGSTSKRYRLSIRNEFADRFRTVISLTCHSKWNRLGLYRKADLEDFPIDRDVYFDQIISIEEVDETGIHVYDLTVETTRNFQLANGLNVRDTFHKAGSAVATVITGVPRFSELMSATKNPKGTVTKVYFKEKFCSIEEIKDRVYANLVHTSVYDITRRMYRRSSKRVWYPAYTYISSIDIPDQYTCISIQTQTSVLYDRRLQVRTIAQLIQNTFTETICIPSPESVGIIDVWAMDTCIDDKFIKKLKHLTLKGVVGLSSVSYMKENDELYILVGGCNLLDLFRVPIVDSARTFSNHIWEIYSVMGIEATREFLIQEFHDVVASDGYTNRSHIDLLVDAMTYTGSITSISRFGVHRNQSGPLTKASFEKTVDNFLKSALNGDIDSTNGVSSAIVCGKPSCIGTGMPSLLYFDEDDM